MWQAPRMASLVSTCGRFSAKFGHRSEWNGVSGLLFIRKLMISCCGRGRSIWSTHSNKISVASTRLKLNFVPSYSGNREVMLCGGRRNVVLSVFHCEKKKNEAKCKRFALCLSDVRQKWNFLTSIKYPKRPSSIFCWRTFNLYRNMFGIFSSAFHRLFNSVLMFL